MRPQKRPFTVQVKRRKRSNSEETPSIFADTPDLKAMMQEAERADADEDHEADFGSNVSARGNASSRHANESPAGSERRPRILDAPTPEPYRVEQQVADEPEVPAKRKRGRPRKKPATVLAQDTVEMDASAIQVPAKSSIAKVAVKPIENPAESFADALPTPAPSGSRGSDLEVDPGMDDDDDTFEIDEWSSLDTNEIDPSESMRRASRATRRLPRSRRADFPLGERWKRHLPRWSR